MTNVRQSITRAVAHYGYKEQKKIKTCQRLLLKRYTYDVYIIMCVAFEVIS